MRVIVCEAGSFRTILIVSAKLEKSILPVSSTLCLVIWNEMPLVTLNKKQSIQHLIIHSISILPDSNQHPQCLKFSTPGIMNLLNASLLLKASTQTQTQTNTYTHKPKHLKHASSRSQQHELYPSKNGHWYPLFCFICPTDLSKCASSVKYSQTVLIMTKLSAVVVFSSDIGKPLSRAHD